MSLVTFITNNRDVREYFRREFKKPNFQIKRDILAAPLSTRYTLLGTAFDYLLRFYIQHLNPLTIDRDEWVAESATKLIINNQLRLKSEKIISQAKERLNRYLKSGIMGTELIKSSLLLAQLDPIYRAGVGHKYIGKIYKEDIADLQKLISVVNPDNFKAKSLSLINPTFGFASSMVGGADADLVIDDMIIDIKTTKYFKLQRRDFNEIIGYYILHKISSVGELFPKPKITKISIYFSRFAYLYVIDLKDIINERTFPNFVQWFKERANQEYKTFIDGHENHFKLRYITDLRKVRQNNLHSIKSDHFSLEMFIEYLNKNNFKVSPRSSRLYYNKNISNIRFVIVKRVIRLESLKNNHGRYWQLIRSFSISNDLNLAVNAVDILLEDIKTNHLTK